MLGKPSGFKWEQKETQDEHVLQLTIISVCVRVCVYTYTYLRNIFAFEENKYIKTWGNNHPFAVWALNSSQVCHIFTTNQDICMPNTDTHTGI